MSQINEDEIKKRFEAVSKFEISPEATSRDLERTKESLTKLTSEPQQSGQNIWSIIMKSNISKLATAAVIVIAAIIILNQFGGPYNVSSIAWADVIEPILNARTASLDIIIGGQENQIIIHDNVMGSYIHRTMSNLETATLIIDLDQMQLLTLDEATKTAVFVDLQGLGDIENYIDNLKNLIYKLQDTPDFQVDNLGLQDFRGQKYVVFLATVRDISLTIWADPQTGLPVRIEELTPNMQIICENLQFDIELDPSMFSMEVPDGFTVQNTGVDFGRNNEEDFIETLRIWAEIIEDGHFPDGIALEDVVNIGPKFEEGLKRAQLTDQEQLEVATKWGQGYVFIRMFKGQGQWYYAGKGVMLGDFETPIFWYQPRDSQTWRVIYGDLSVADAVPENLPK